MRDNRHNLTHQMIGKRDLAGRFLTEIEKQAVLENKMSIWPESIFWSEKTTEAEDQIINIIGKDAFNAWVLTQPENDTWIVMCKKAREKLKQLQDNLKGEQHGNK